MECTSSLHTHWILSLRALVSQPFHSLPRSTRGAESASSSGWSQLSVCTCIHASEGPPYTHSKHEAECVCVCVWCVCACVCLHTDIPLCFHVDNNKSSKVSCGYTNSCHRQIDYHRGLYTGYFHVHVYEAFTFSCQASYTLLLSFALLCFPSNHFSRTHLTLHTYVLYEWYICVISFSCHLF